MLHSASLNFGLSVKVHRSECMWQAGNWGETQKHSLQLQTHTPFIWGLEEGQPRTELPWFSLLSWKSPSKRLGHRPVITGSGPRPHRPGRGEKALRPCGSRGGLRPSPQPRCRWAVRVGKRLARPCSAGSPVTWTRFRSQECEAERRPRSGGGAEGTGSAPRGSSGRAQPPREPAGQPVSGCGGRADGRARRAPQRLLRGGGGSWFRLRAQRWWRRRNRLGCNRRPSGSGWSGSGGWARREATPQGSGGSGGSGGSRRRSGGRSSSSKTDSWTRAAAAGPGRVSRAEAGGESSPPPPPLPPPPPPPR